MSFDGANNCVNVHSYLWSVTLTNWEIIKHFANIFMICSHLVKLQNTRDKKFMLHENFWLLLGCFDECKSNFERNGKISAELSSIYEPLLLADDTHFLSSLEYLLEYVLWQFLHSPAFPGLSDLKAKLSGLLSSFWWNNSKCLANTMDVLLLQMSDLRCFVLY